jgi:AraC-like DNA-binding protein
MKDSLSINKKTIELNQIASFGDQKYPSFELRIIFEYLTSIGYLDWCQQQMSGLELDQSSLYLPFIRSHQALDGLNRVINEFYRLGLGCDIAQRYRLKDLGVIGVCVGNTETLGEAMEITQAYYDLIGSFTDIINISDEKTFTNRLIDVARLNPQVLRFLFELTFTGMVTLSEELSGQKLSIQIIRFSAVLSNEEKKYYQELFDCKVEDECKFNEWVIGMDALKTPIINKSDSPSEAETNLKYLLEELNKEQGLVDNIDCILKGSSGDFPDPDMISHALGMSSRTLRRKLNKIGVSFRGLMDKVRCQLAINLIQHKNLSNEDLAEELGYSDAANFYNAFKKWTGHSPSFYRL